MRRIRSLRAFRSWLRGLKWPASALAFACAIVALCGSNPGFAQEQVAVRQIADALGFDEADRKRAERGEFVWIEQDEETKKQISIAAAAIIPLDLDEAYRRSVRGEVFRVDETMLAFGEIVDPKAAAESIDRMPLDEDELHELASAEPGEQFNLSPEEWKAIAAGDRNDLGSVAKTYRTLLANRAKRFAAQGLDGIAPYARPDGGQVDAASELRGLIAADEVLRMDWPELYQSIVGYPKIVTEEPIDSRFFWTVQKIQDRPTPILRHRMTVRARDRVVVVDRQFYAAQSYNVLQVIAGAFETAEGTVLIYSNRTSTDQVAGFGSAAAHAIGRKLMAKEVEALFDASIESLVDAPN
jgi:hypothetical protein